MRICLLMYGMGKTCAEREYEAAFEFMASMLLNSATWMGNSTMNLVL